MRKSVDWIQRHIFPGSLLPSLAAMQKSLWKSSTLGIQQMEDLAPSYCETLSRWRERFNRNSDQISKMGFSPRFIRKWNYYLAYCEAAFRTRNITVAQILFSRPNNRELDRPGIRVQEA
jgi:cyclopropane-fatty-acyl-phospholipid synthase